ncbi:MAG TPA: protein kinase [Pyrinomonadaceae bacterium]|jgi:eukaryotic-like serine/threonine-protein kinase|nr:protein kinase [Pyrinomonadaceae bacterium]
MSAQPAPIKRPIDPSRWREVKRLFQAAIDLPGEARTEFLRTECKDQGIREQVDCLLAAHESADDFISHPALVEAGLASCDESSSFRSLIGQHIGQYEIIRELGRGGMGSVFLANRVGGDFNKQVALKIIKRGMDTEAILQRFVFERQVLANLQHPNIAGFLDGGTTDDGLPFFVMEYVDGEPITKYCDANRLNTTERLRLFQKACTAVRHAHQNLIVHRDLKPSNILVTREGIPKLLDFGIAKLVSSDHLGEAEQTATAFRVMTPEYASPEQIRGLPITTATDVYSLGVVLYELLSGHRPFRFANRSPEEVAQVVLTTDPLPPSQMISTSAVTDMHSTANVRLAATTNQTFLVSAKSLRGDLDNIVLKALRRERERRYSSVLELSEDIRRHLDGLPVTARPDTFTYRAGKFIQRHRAGVVMASALFLILLTATTVTSWQAYVARREHTKAQLRMVEQRKLVSSLINEVQKSLKDVPYSLRAQRMIAQKSLDYLNNLAKDAGDDPAYLGELADAYRNLGYLQAWTLQDNPSALISYDKGIELSRKRLAIEPNNPVARRALADALGNKIESLRLMQRADEAAETFAEMLSLQQQLLNGQPDDAERMMAVAETSQVYGEVLQAIERNDEAKTKIQASVDLGSRAVDVAKAQANTPQQRVDLALMQEKLGSIFEDAGDLKQAEQIYREAVATAAAVHREHPEIVQGYRNTTSSHWILGMLLDREGDHQAALETYRGALKTSLDATAADPSVDPVRAGEMKYSIVVGRELCKLGQKEEGLKLLHRGIDLTLNLIESEKGNRQSEYYGTETLSWAVEGLSAAGLRDEAKSLSLKMIGWADEVAQNLPQDGGPRMRLAILYEQLGDVYSGYDPGARRIGAADRSRLIEARGWYDKADQQFKDLENFQISRSIVQRESAALQERIAASGIEGRD